MFRTILKVTPFIFLSMCLMLNNNVAHAGGVQSSAVGTSQGGFGGGSFGGGGASRGF